jgi:[protein-PII] uridylyltransferase
MFTATLADGNAHYEISPHQFHDATELRLCARAQPAMLARLSWACATNGMSIVSARCFSHPAGVAIAALEFQSFDNKPVTDQRKLKKLAEQLNRVTQPGTAMPEGKIAQPRKSARLEAVQVIESVDIDNNISASHTVIEITARDRIGLLYDLSRKSSELGLDVHTAHISTYGVKAVDVFYVQDIFGEKITSPDRLELIKSSLL